MTQPDPPRAARARPAPVFPFARDTRWHIAATVLALLLLLAWDRSGLDLALARPWGDHFGFSLRDNWLLVDVLHDGARLLSWLVVMGLCLTVWWAPHAFRTVTTLRRLQGVCAIFLALVLVTSIKRVSATSCPWDLAEFGGVARYVSHWGWGLVDGGSGHCFPAGHASAGFAFLGLYFAYRHDAPLASVLALFLALCAGFLLGGAQQMRGAHFMSHTLWTGWLCWAAGLACDLVFSWLKTRGGAHGSALAGV